MTGETSAACRAGGPQGDRPLVSASTGGVSTTRIVRPLRADSVHVDDRQEAVVTRGATTMMEADGPFGSVFGPTMSVSRYASGRWSAVELAPIDSFSLHPGTHALHYGSACFEGLKAHRQPDRRVVPFRADVHIERLRRSAVRLRLPVPPAELARGPHRRRRRGQRTHRARTARLAVPAADDARHGRDDRCRGDAEPGRHPVRAGLPRRRLPPARQADGLRGDGDSAHHSAVRCRQERGQLRHGSLADHGTPATPMVRTRCCSRPAVGSRRRAHRTSCSSTGNTS